MNRGTLRRERSSARSINRNTRTRHLLLAAAAIAPASQAQIVPDDPAQWARDRGVALTQPDPRLLNRWGISLRFGFNVRAEFKNQPDGSTLTDPGPATGNGIDRIYDDGHVGPDESYPFNNQLTSFWGYNNAPQFGATDIFFHSATAAAGGTTDNSAGGTSIGLEVYYGREISVTEFGSWGFEGAAGFAQAIVNDRDPLHGTVSLLTDAYSLGSPPIMAPTILPHVGPYAGGNAPVIADTPNSRTIASVPGTITGNRSLSAHIYDFRVGPYFDFRLSPKTKFQLGAGAAFAVVDSNISFLEHTSTEAGGSVTRSGSDDKTGVVFGAFVAGHVLAQITREWHVFGGAQFQTLSDFKQTAGTRSATLDLSKTLYFTAGVGYNF